MFKKWTRLMLKILKPFTIFAKKGSSVMFETIFILHCPIRSMNFFKAPSSSYLSCNRTVSESIQFTWLALFLLLFFFFFFSLFLYLASKVNGFIVYQYISINNISWATSCNFQLSSCFNFLFTKFPKNS